MCLDACVCLVNANNHFKTGNPFLTDALAFGSGHFGPGSGDIFLDNVGCTGSEVSLLDCSHDTSVSCSSGHSEDAGVRCHGESFTSTRLIII